MPWFPHTRRGTSQSVRAAITKYNRPSSLWTGETYFPQLRSLGSPRSWYRQIVCLERAHPLDLNVSTVVEGVKGLSGVSFQRALIAFKMAPSSWPNHLVPRPNPSHMYFKGVKIQHMYFAWGRGHTNIQSQQGTYGDWSAKTLLCYDTLRLYLLPVGADGWEERWLGTWDSI